MERSSANPLFLVLFFLIRCLVPLLIMLGVSYLLRRLGLIKETLIPPNHRDETEKGAPPDDEDASNHGNGGLAHGSL